MRGLKYLVIFILSLTIAVSVGGCSSSENTTSVESAPQYKADEMEKETADKASLEEMGIQETQTIELTLGSNQINRKMIKTGQLEIETKSFEETLNSIFAKIEEIQGFVENSYVEGNSYHSDISRRTGQITARIPHNVFDKFINEANSFGNIVARSVQGEDITDKYVDTQARLKSLVVQRERLMELLEKTGTLEELFAVEKELANVNYEIEQFQGTLNKYDNLVNYSTVEINVREVRDYYNTEVPNSLGERIANRFSHSLKELKRLGEEVLLIIVSVIPFIIVIGLPIVIVILIIYTVLKKRKIKQIEKLNSQKIREAEKERENNNK